MVAERYRGAPRLNMNPETGETLCIACNLCSLACPENLIVVGWHRDDATRRKVLTNFTYDTSRCMFLWIVRGSPAPPIASNSRRTLRMASCYSREGAIWDRHRLEEGPHACPLHAVMIYRAAKQNRASTKISACCQRDLLQIFVPSRRNPSAIRCLDLESIHGAS